jgi:hypothetical protein
LPRRPDPAISPGMAEPRYSPETPDEKEARIAAAAARALAEAAARRAGAKPADRPREIGGRDGPEPVRYGDYEIRGIACDF